MNVLATAAVSALCLMSSAKRPAAPPEPQEAGCPHAHDERADAAAPEVKDVPGQPILRGERVPARSTVEIAELLKDPTKSQGHVVVVEGQVRRACTHRGCWMELGEATQGPGLRVTFLDDGFFVPTNSAGFRARVVGAVSGTKAEPKLVATGVELRRL